MPHNPNQLKTLGMLLVISAPSGCGKTAIITALLKREKNIVLSVSTTTRPKRPGEIDGKDYNFVTIENFNSKLEQASFLEYAKVYDNYYGTPRDCVMDNITKGIDVIFDIDYQGMRQVSHSVGYDVVSIFLLPPSFKELESRLRNRGLDTPEVIERRLATMRDDLNHWQHYDYIVINDNLDNSIAQVKSIITSERLKRIRQPYLGEFVRLL